MRELKQTHKSFSRTKRDEGFCDLPMYKRMYNSIFNYLIFVSFKIIEVWYVEITLQELRMYDLCHVWIMSCFTRNNYLQTIIISRL